ncbi:MAG: DUF1848 domain-containing protein [Pseudomonadota bacterium]
MGEPKKIVLSASRRTDIPAFYMDWFMDRLRQGSFELENPFSRAVTTISARPGDVHSIVFWSKDYGPFLSADRDRELDRLGYFPFFLFTVNSESLDLEPWLPPLAARLDQLRALAGLHGGAVTWRFDPLCFFEKNGEPGDNLADFEKIARAASKAGISRCVTSFMDPYRKIAKRLASQPGFAFREPSPEERAAVLGGMKEILDSFSISLFLCCEKELLESLGPESGIRPHACVDHALLAGLYGAEGLSFSRDRGQRAGAGCGCHESRDVGVYRLHPCSHACLYCYANPRFP